jgi:P-type Cu+ transporter
MAIVTKDPVREMTADPKAGVRRGQTNREPAKAAASSGTIYTCPMHPQIRQVGPGNCPICGMTLDSWT